MFVAGSLYGSSVYEQHTRDALVERRQGFRAIHGGFTGGIGQFVPGGWAAVSAEPIPQFNMAFIDDDADVTSVLETYASMIAGPQVPMLVLTTPSVAGTLAQCEWPGLSGAGAMPLMSLSADTVTEADPVDSTFDVVLATTPEHLTTSVDIQAEAFGVPPDMLSRVNRNILGFPTTQLFLAMREAEAYSTVMTTAVDGVIGIWSMATRPVHQRKGTGRALLTAVVAHHRGAGSDLFYLSPSDEGRRLYECMGFVEREQTPMWLLSPPD